MGVALSLCFRDRLGAPIAIDFHGGDHCTAMPGNKVSGGRKRKSPRSLTGSGASKFTCQPDGKGDWRMPGRLGAGCGGLAEELPQDTSPQARQIIPRLIPYLRRSICPVAARLTHHTGLANPTRHMGPRLSPIHRRIGPLPASDRWRVPCSGARLSFLGRPRSFGTRPGVLCHHPSTRSLLQ
jgi:hypothetical protein